MKTLIIPCVECKMINNYPIFLHKYPDGTLLAEKAIVGVCPKQYDRIIYTIEKEIDEKYSASKILLEEVGKKIKIEVLIISEKTHGPAETIYKTLIQSNVQGEFAVRDSHNYIELDSAYSGNFVAGLDLTGYEGVIENLRAKSFIVLNEQSQILDIVEKKFCSDIISVGLYGFKSDAEYIKTYEHLNLVIPEEQKLYVSHIISYLIGYSNKVYHCFSVKIFEDWSSNNAWACIQKKYATFFLDMDKLLEETDDIDNASQLLKNLVKEGAMLIGYTSFSNEYASQIKEKMHLHKIISNCTFSNMKAIVKDWKTIKSILSGV